MDKTQIKLKVLEDLQKNLDDRRAGCLKDAVRKKKGPNLDKKEAKKFVQGFLGKK